MKILNLEKNETVENPDILQIGFHKVNRELLDKYPTVKMVASRTTATDHIDVKLLKKRNIKLIKLNGEELLNVTAVPELIMCLMLELVRKNSKQELKGKTLGIIGGNGRVGKLLEERAKSFGMRIIINDIN